MTIGQITNFLDSYCNHLFPRQAACLIAAIALCLSAGSARAAPPPTVLILSVAEDGRQQDGLSTQVGELVQRAGARLAETADLSASARKCEEPVCLTKLADDHRAEFVLAARIERRCRHDRLIDMWLAVGSLATAVGASALNGQAHGNTCSPPGSQTGCYYDL